MANVESAFKQGDQSVKDSVANRFDDGLTNARRDYLLDIRDVLQGTNSGLDSMMSQFPNADMLLGTNSKDLHQPSGTKHEDELTSRVEPVKPEGPPSREMPLSIAMIRAESVLNRQVGLSVNSQDARTLYGLHRALVRGQQQDLSDAIKNMTPEQFTRYMTALERNLTAVNSPVRAHVDRDGVTFSWVDGNEGVRFDRQGNVSVHSISQRPDRTIALGPAVRDHRPDAFTRLGLSATDLADRY